MIDFKIRIWVIIDVAALYMVLDVIEHLNTSIQSHYFQFSKIAKIFISLIHFSSFS